MTTCSGDHTGSLSRIRWAGVIVLSVVLAGCVAAAVAADDPGRADGEARLPLSAPALEPAARAAGCQLRSHRFEGREHTSARVRYRTNPPTSGDHDPVAAQDGLYALDNPPDVEQSVHALEHGRILVQFAPATSARRRAQLRRLVDEEVKGSPGYHTLLFRNQTRMPYAVAGVAWRKSLTCRRFNDRTVDAIRQFRRAYVDKGPEFIP